MWSEAGLWVCWFWDLLGGTAVQDNISCCLAGSGQPVWSYRIIHSLWLPLLGLVVHRNDQTVHQGGLLPAPGLETGQQKFQGIPGSTSTYLCLPVACLAQSPKLPLAVLKLHER